MTCSAHDIDVISRYRVSILLVTSLIVNALKIIRKSIYGLIILKKTHQCHRTSVCAAAWLDEPTQKIC